MRLKAPRGIRVGNLTLRQRADLHLVECVFQVAVARVGHERLALYNEAGVRDVYERQGSAHAVAKIVRNGRAALRRLVMKGKLLR